MKIDFRRSGGFAGSSLTCSVDTAALSCEEAEEIERLVAGADLAALASTAEQRNAGADRFQYVLLTDGERRHDLSIGERDAPDSLRPLLDRLLARARGS